MHAQTVKPLYVEAHAPPSSYAIADAIEGKPGAWPRVAGLTAVRTAFILPGLLLAGIRGKQALTGATYGSVGISLYLLALYGSRKRKTER